MPQLMPLYWNYSILMLSFIIMMMINVYMWYNKMHWWMGVCINYNMNISWMW